MTSSSQLSMFEPEGAALSRLVSVHLNTADVERRKAENLFLAGFKSAAESRNQYAQHADQSAAVCEMALQFEVMAGLS